MEMALFSLALEIDEGAWGLYKLTMSHFHGRYRVTPTLSTPCLDCLTWKRRAPRKENNEFFFFCDSDYPLTLFSSLDSPMLLIPLLNPSPSATVAGAWFPSMEALS
jgi:hypothetical protein